MPSQRRQARDSDVAVHAGFLLLALGVWWPTRNLPYHWDGASFVVEAARSLDATSFSPFIAPYSDFAHPPLFVALLAFAWRVFGERLLVAHVLLFPFLPLTLSAIYCLGRDVADRSVGLAAALAFLAAPVVLEEYAQVYMDLPLALFTTTALWTWLRERRIATAVFLCLAAATKLPSMLVPLVLLLATLVEPSRRRDVRMYAALASPFAVVLAWLSYHSVVTGWMLSKPGRARHLPASFVLLAGNVRDAAGQIFVSQGRWIVALLALSAVVTCVLRQAALPRRYILGAFFALPIACCLAFSLFGEYLQRYGIFVLPPFFVATFALLRATDSRLLFGAGFVGICGAQLATLHPSRGIEKTFATRPDEDLGALDTIRTGVDAANWLDANYPNAHIYGSFPESYQVTEPYQGYVDHAYAFSQCNGADLNYLRHAPDEEPQLLYIQRYSPAAEACSELSQFTHARALKLFVVNGHWIEIRRIPRGGF